MREMGAVDLLDRKGEIAIAKRIEEGMLQIQQTLASYPGTVQTLLDQYEAYLRQEVKMTDLLAGFIDMSQSDEIATPIRKTANSAPTPKKRGPMGPDREEAKRRFAALKKVHVKAIESLRKRGSSHRTSVKWQQAVLQQFIEFKLAPRLLDRLIHDLREDAQKARRFEREIMALCVKNAKMPRQEFIALFPGHETDTRWVTRMVKRKAPYSEAMTYIADDIIYLQNRIVRLQDAACRCRRSKKSAAAYRWARPSPPRQERNVRGEPALGDFHRQKIHQSRHAIP